MGVQIESYAELSTILAALRYWQAAGDARINSPEEEIATSGGEIDPLSDDDIDDLCERLNCGYEGDDVP